MTALTIVCAVGGGALFPVTDFTIARLKRLPPSRRIAAMQSINKTAASPLLLLAGGLADVEPGLTARPTCRRWAASGDQNTSAPRSRAMQRFICALVGTALNPSEGADAIVLGSRLADTACAWML